MEDLHIAYQVLGEGPDLIWVPGWVSHVEHWWEHPRPASFMRRLASFARLILFDKRGTGMSDRHGGLPTIDDRLDDMKAVLDATGSEQASVLGVSFEGSVLASMWAATYPERTSALILFGATAKLTRSEDYPWGLPAEFVEAMVQIVQERWNDDAFAIEMMAPSHAGDSGFREWFAKWGRLASSPGAASSLLRSLARVDIRTVLPAIQARSLVLHRTGDPTVPPDAGRYVAASIPGAEFHEIPGDDTAIFCCEDDAILGRIRGFLTGEPGAPAPDRVFATILFTDIVGSTDLAAKLSPDAWRELLEAHDLKVRAEVEEQGGTLIKTTGDGILALFDRPARAVECALRLTEVLPGSGITIRSGLHTGTCERIGNDIGGLTVHVAARVLSKAGSQEVLLTSTVADLIDDPELRFEDRGTHELRGVPGQWSLLAGHR